MSKQRLLRDRARALVSSARGLVRGVKVLGLSSRRHNGGVPSIRRRLAWLVGACLLPLWLAGGIGVYALYTERSELTQQRLLETAKALSLATDRELAVIAASLESLGTSPFILSGEQQAFYRQAQEVVRQQQAIKISLMDPTAREVVNTILPFGTPPRLQSRPEAVTRLFETGKMVVADSWVGPLSRLFQFGVGIPIRRDGQVVYDLAMSVPCSRLTVILADQQLAPGEVAGLVDRSGRVMARVPESDRYVGLMGRPEFLSFIASHDQGTLAMKSFDGVPLTAAAYRSVLSGWVVVVGMPTAALMEGVRVWLWLTLAGILASTGAALALALYFGHKIAAPVRALVAPALALGEERLEEEEGRVRTCGPFGLREADEVGQALMTAFRLLQRHAVEREWAAASLVESEQRFSTIFHNAPVGIAMGFLEDGRFVEVNDAWTRILGYRQEELIGRSGRELEMWVDLNARAEMFHTLKSGQPVPTFETVFRKKTGELIDVSTTGRVVTLAGKHYLLGLITDISARKRAEEQIRFMAHHDPLTGLPNRLLVRDRFEQAMAHSDRNRSRVAMLYLDLDKFKVVNDTLSHATGDALLQGVAGRLRECVRETDTISRHGGDEFLIMLPDMYDTGFALTISEKILERLVEPFPVEGHELSITASMGVALYPDDGRDFDTLLRKADTAMYHAKDAGSNTCRFFEPRMNIDAVENLRLRHGLRLALERNEFVFHYQPQIDLATGAVVGAEALIRWNHPELGLLAPGRFIAIAEESGLIVPIGEWGLREACRQAVAWQKAGLPQLVVAVNLSSVQFKRGDINQVVVSALLESGLDPALLELELTESILIADTETVLLKIKRLKAFGVKLSIDDFGTGYSSLAYLKRFAVDRLKIDQSFVRDMATDANDATIVRTIIQMARSLGLRTIAEGVEDAQLMELLRQYQCDEVQGYHISRPIPAEAFAAYLKTAPL